MEEGTGRIEKDKNAPSFANIVGGLSRDYLIPFKVSLALGTERRNYELFKRDIMDLDGVTIRQMRLLRSLEVGDQKKALKEILSPETFDVLEIKKMGPINTERLAHFVWDKAMYRIESPK